MRFETIKPEVCFHCTVACNRMKIIHTCVCVMRVWRSGCLSFVHKKMGCDKEPLIEQYLIDSTLVPSFSTCKLTPFLSRDSWANLMTSQSRFCQITAKPGNPLQKGWDSTAKTLRNGSKTPCIRITRFCYVFVSVFTRECYPLAKDQARLLLLDFVASGFRWHISQVIPVSTRNKIKHLFATRL